MTRREGLAVAATATVAFLAAIAGVDARATYGARVTADEPQYLLTAQSLVDDGDLDISDEIAERAYLPYHEITIDRQTAILDDGREISPHDPLLPALLALPMAIGGWAFAKTTIALFAAAAAAAAAWVAMRRFGVAANVAGVVTSSVFAGLPLAGYGSQVYPEMAAGLAAVVGFGALTAPTLRRRHLVAGAAMVVALPWLAVKYVPVAAVLATGLLVRTRSPRARLPLAAVLAAAGAAYLLAHRVWYGGWTVYATGDHFEQTGEFSVVGTRIDLLGRSRRIVGLLVDREFGLAAWSPVWLLLPVAVAWMVSRRPAGWAWWSALVAAGWLNATFVALTMHGWWVPGRQVVVVLPIAAVGLALVVDRTRLLAPTVVLALLGAVNWLWLTVEASTGRRTLVADFMETTAPAYRLWRFALPSGIADRRTDQLLLAVWASLFVVATVAIRRRGSTPRSGDPATDH